MKEKKVFVCSECGWDAPKWSGQCPSCHSWNTMEEMLLPPKDTRQAREAFAYALPSEHKPLPLSGINPQQDARFSTGISEFDRVLGGGAVCGSLVLISGEPGIGKSTLLLQACDNISMGSGVLYVSGEESASQIKLRADRLKTQGANLLILSETDITAVIRSAESMKPSLVVIDSIQTSFSPLLSAAPGSISQIRECTFSLMQYAKASNTTVIIVGHINKDGSVAGPKLLEHMVDCVLYFEGQQHISYRLLRAAKNRFGSTNEVAVFDMTAHGLREVKNPSEALLSGRPEHSPGSCVGCTIEGTRPILAEIQALVTKSSFGIPRRMSAGFDYNRMSLIMAILEKRAGLMLSSYDAYVNVIGGLKIDEPAIDLPAALAIASSFRDTPVTDKLTAFGELGLTGELRSVTSPEQRLGEIARLGFKHCIIPDMALDGVKLPDELNVIRVKNIRQAISAALSPDNFNT